jgi:uncharacterized protein YkwD
MTTSRPLMCFIALTLVLAACASPQPKAITPTRLPVSSLTPTVSATTAHPAATLAAAQPSPTAGPTKIQYTVRPGDTLLGIALQHHISMASIQLANDLGESDLLRAGQTLAIPTSLQWEGELPYWIVHTVQRGETVSGIAQAFDLTASDVLRVNAIADPGQIRPGQSIVIPLDSLQVAAVPPTPTPKPAPTRKPTPTSAAPRVLTSPLPSPLPRPPTSTTTVPTPAPIAIPSDIAAWPGTVVTLINQKRAAHGLPPYSIAPELVRAAQAHAADCTKRGWCGHVGSDGADTKTREIRAGYNPTAWGENWVQAFDPVKAVEWWYNETPPNDPHRKNLLHTRYTQIGIGITPAGNGYYFIADFGSR